MNRLSTLWVAVAMSCACGGVAAQSFTVAVGDTVLSGPLGSELVFNCTFTNISSSPLTLAIVRTLNNLPDGWQSSFCFDVCFAPFVDSIATTPSFGSSPLLPGTERPFSVHVLSATNQGTGIIRVLVKDLANPSDCRTITFTASTVPTGVRIIGPAPLTYSLSQNYPNPWNPTTTIRYGLPHASPVTLTVYNALGKQVVQLVNEQQQAGYHDVVFCGDGLASGVYFYRLKAGDFVATKKLLLLR